MWQVCCRMLAARRPLQATRTQKSMADTHGRRSCSQGRRCSQGCWCTEGPVPTCAETEGIIKWLSEERNYGFSPTFDYEKLKLKEKLKVQ